MTSISTANVALPYVFGDPRRWCTRPGSPSRPGPVTGQVEPGQRYQAAVSVGTNLDVLRGAPAIAEAFVLDRTADLTVSTRAVDFVSRIRVRGTVRPTSMPLSPR